MSGTLRPKTPSHIHYQGRETKVDHEGHVKVDHAGGTCLRFSVRMLRPDRACGAILEGLQECGRWGTVSKGTHDVGRPKPFQEQLRSSQLGHAWTIERGDDERTSNDAGSSSSITLMWTTSPTTNKKRGSPPSADMESRGYPSEGVLRLSLAWAGKNCFLTFTHRFPWTSMI